MKKVYLGRPDLFPPTTKDRVAKIPIPPSWRKNEEKIRKAAIFEQDVKALQIWKIIDKLKHQK